MQPIALLPFALALAASFPTRAEDQTPAERHIEAAQAAVAEKPEDAPRRASLAMAYARRARETADPVYYERALAELERARELAPDDFATLRALAWVKLGRHEFDEALELARELNRRFPDDVLTYGLVVDACVELGLYQEAEVACQWMLDLRPGNVPALTRAAYLREIFGDAEGALELMTSAFHSTGPRESEDRAWILTQVGHLYASLGRLREAEDALAGALGQFPDYHYALAQLARVRAAQGRHADAAALLRTRWEAAPHPENLFDLACALARSGELDEARARFRAFEQAARAESGGRDNANRELVRFYAQDEWSAFRGELGPAEGLALAEHEASWRDDVATRALVAEALLAAGRADEARVRIDSALAVGTRDAALLELAGRIALAQGDTAGARARWDACLETCPVSEVSGRARTALERLPAGPPAAFVPADGLGG